MVNNNRLQELQNLSESYNMMNAERSLTTIVPSTESLIDVIIINKDIPISTTVVDTGFSDHLTRILKIVIGTRNRRSETAVRRQFTHNSTEEFKHFLSQELWSDIYN
jgi:hypothetical protein